MQGQQEMQQQYNAQPQYNARPMPPPSMSVMARVPLTQQQYSQRQAQNQYNQQPSWDDASASESSGTMNEDTPQTRAGPGTFSLFILAGPRGNDKPNVPVKSYALVEGDKGVRTNLGNTAFVMSILSEMWLFNLVSHSPSHLVFSSRWDILHEFSTACELDKLL